MFQLLVLSAVINANLNLDPKPNPSVILTLKLTVKITLTVTVTLTVISGTLDNKITSAGTQTANPIVPYQ